MQTVTLLPAIPNEEIANSKLARRAIQAVSE